MIRSPRVLVSILPIAAVVVACSSSSSGGVSGKTGSAVAGAQDAHCTSVVTVDPAACTAIPDAGMTDGGMPSPYGDTLYNAEGDDDDCKYHVKWTASPIQQGVDVTFTLAMTYKKDGSPVRMASQRLEVFLNDTHPAPNSDQKGPETSPGTYADGPIRFDAPGRWTVRFHFHEECNDAPTSPHGHAAFYVDVP
jgi:hypothetical protein